MDVIELIAVMGFALTCFLAGYSFGKDTNNTQK